MALNDRRLVVTRGNPWPRSNRICLPKTLRASIFAPVERSTARVGFLTPWVRTSRSKARYCFIRGLPGQSQEKSDSASPRIIRSPLAAFQFLFSAQQTRSLEGDGVVRPNEDPDMSQMGRRPVGKPAEWNTPLPRGVFENGTPLHAAGLRPEAPAAGPPHLDLFRRLGTWNA